MPITLKTNSGKVDLTTPAIVQKADLTNYYTKDETDAAIDVAIEAIPAPDLSGYALKTDIPSLDGYAKTSDIPDVSNFITEIPAEYVTDTELEAKGYLTEHQQLKTINNQSIVGEGNIAIAGGGEPDAYIKSAAVDGNKLTLTNKDDTIVEFEPAGGSGGSVAIDNKTIVKNEDGTIGTAIGGCWVDGLVDGPTIVEITGTSTDVSSQITYDVMQTLINTENLRANLKTGFGAESGCLVDIDTSTADTYKLTCKYTITTVNIVYTGTGTADNWSCIRSFEGGSSGFSTSNSFYSLVIGKLPSPINSANFLPLSEDFTVDSDKLKLNWLQLTANKGFSFNYNQSNKYANYSGSGSLSGGWASYNEGSNGICWGSNINNSGIGTEVFEFGNQIYTKNNPCYSFATNMINYIAKNYSFVAGNYSNWYGSTFGQGVAVFGQGNSPASDWSFNTGKWSAFDTDKQYAHIVGNGTSNSARSNAYTLDWSGNATFSGTVSSAGADYAELFEWQDKNPEAEDRIGYIVTLDGDKIKYANDGDDILGIISGTAMVLGDNAEWNWRGRFLTDDFGRIIYEDREVTHEAAYNEDGEKVADEWTEMVHAPVTNPAYNPSQPYINRRNRPEWATVGMMGKLYVRDDGTSQVNGYVTANNGIATASETRTNMRVMERVSNNIIRVLLK